jgi:hypothetical protein
MIAPSNPLPHRALRLAAWLVAAGLLITAFDSAIDIRVATLWTLGLWAWLALVVWIDRHYAGRRVRILGVMTLGALLAGVIVYLQGDELRTFAPLTDAQAAATIDRAPTRGGAAPSAADFRILATDSFASADFQGPDPSIVNDIVYVKGRYLLRPVAFAVRIQIANSSTASQRLDGYLIEERQADDTWKRLCNSDPYGNGVYTYSRQTRVLAEIGQTNTLNVRLRGKVLEPNESIEGWAWLGCPVGAACNFRQLRIRLLYSNSEALTQELAIQSVSDTVPSSVQLGHDRIDLSKKPFDVRPGCR